jgi:fatty-acyl-CoA synthase
VQVVLEVDLLRYLTGLKKFIVPFIRPKNPGATAPASWTGTRRWPSTPRQADLRRQHGRPGGAYFHTGGTTGMPKVAQHTYSGMIYNGWVGHTLLFTEEDNVICPLPLFHVFACHVILMAMVASGGHVIFPTPQGYRGEGRLRQFLETGGTLEGDLHHHRAHGHRRDDAAPGERRLDREDRLLGLRPLPVELFHRFEKATGVKLIEGYGLTEATCLVSCNPVDGEKKIGSVGIPFPHCTSGS